MNEEKARKILGDAIQSDNSLYDVGWYINWCGPSEKGVSLDALFTIEELEAIVWWMKNKTRIAK